MHAAGNGHTECTQMLIKAGSDLITDATDDDRYDVTSLMLAAARGHVECARVLINAGSDLTVKGKRAKTAMDLAKDRGHTAVVALLEEAMQQVSHGRSVVIVPTKHHQHVATNLTLATRAGYVLSCRLEAARLR